MKYLIGDENTKLAIKKFRFDNIDVACITIFTPVLVEMVSIIFKLSGFQDTALFTAGFYIITTLFCFYKTKSISQVSILIMSLIFTLFLITYLFFPSRGIYIFASPMIQNYVFYIPLGAACVLRINNWDHFFEKFNIYAIIAIVISLLGLTFLNYGLYIGYMEFSYTIFPFVIGLYLCIRKIKRWKIQNVVFFFIGLIEMLSFGARATILFSILFILTYEFFGYHSKKNSIKTKFVAGIVIVLVIFVFLNYDAILNYLSNFYIFSNSRLIKMFMSDRLIDTTGRELLYDKCKEYIASMGLSINGPFGDRQFCLLINQPYPHNFFYEILMSFGWIIGILIFISLLLMCLTILVNNSTEKDILIFSFFGFFSRYFISGSYIQEGRFWIFLFALISLFKISKKIPFCQSN